MNLAIFEPTKGIRVDGISNIITWTAIFWSYAINHSILWAIFHGAVAPAYIAYRIVFFTNLLPK